MARWGAVWEALCTEPDIREIVNVALRDILWPLGPVPKITSTGSEKISLKFWKEAQAPAGVTSQTGWEEKGLGLSNLHPVFSRRVFLAGSSA